MGSFVLIAAAVISKIAGLLFKIPLTNMLGGVGMGYYSSAFTVFTPVYAICAGSITPAITQYISGKSASADKDKLISVRNSSLIVFGFIGFAVSCGMAGLSDIIAKRIIGNEDAKYAIVAIAPCVFIEAVTAVYRGFFEGQQNMTPTALSQIVEAITRVVFGLGLAYLAKEQSLPYIAAAAVWGATLSNVAGLILLMIKSERGGKGAVIDRRSAVKSIAGLMIPIALASLASSIMSSADLSCIVLGMKASLENDPSLYSEKYSQVIHSGVSLERLPNFLYGTFTGLSMTVFSLVPSLCGVFGRSALPVISHDMAKGDNESVKMQIKRMVLITIYLSLPAGLGISAMAENILKILFSSRQAEIEVATQPLEILGIGAVFLCLSATAFNMLQAIGRQDMPVKITAVGAAVKLVGNLVLIPLPSFELKGAAISSVISYAVMGISSIIILYKIVKIKTNIFISVCTPLLASGLAVIGSKFAENLLSKSLPNLVSTGISVCFAVIIYIIVLLLLDISTKKCISGKIFAK